jgi:hypothetical protein
MSKIYQRLVLCDLCDGYKGNVDCFVCHGEAAIIFNETEKRKKVGASGVTKVEWAQTTMTIHELAPFLTRENFQPGKFHIVTDDVSATVIYVKSEL